MGVKMKKNKDGSKKRFIVPGLVSITLLLFCYFLYLNFPKLRCAMDFNKRIKQIPSAVNVRIVKGGMPLFRKSFAWNRGSVYIAPHCNITNHLQENEDDVVFFVNGQRFTTFTLFRFKNFSAVPLKKTVFVFTGSGYGIKKIVELEKHSQSFFKLLTVKTIGGEAEKLYGAYGNAALEIKNSSGKNSPGNGSLTIPVTFKQNKVYELSFDYMITGDTIPRLALTRRSREEEVSCFRYLLYRPPESGFRRASILFSPARDIDPAKLILSRSKRKGIVCYKNISVFKYPDTDTGPAFLTKSKIVYDDFYRKLLKEYIGKKSYDENRWQI